MKPRKKWNETVVADYMFDGQSLKELKENIESLITEYGVDARFKYVYYGYDNAYEVNLEVEVEEDDSTYFERIHQEALKERRALEKKERKAKAKAEKIALEATAKEEAERKLYESLREKYGDN